MKNVLEKLIEHNNWANLKILQACSALSEDHLDATPQPGQWSIRQNLVHLVEAQQGYLSLLALPPEAREKISLSFDELETSVKSSGEGLVALVREDKERSEPVKSRKGHRIEPWVIMVQAMNHGAEHRKQIAGLMRALGVDPPDMDGWTFGDEAKAIIRVP